MKFILSMKTTADWVALAWRKHAFIQNLLALFFLRQTKALFQGICKNIISLSVFYVFLLLYSQSVVSQQRSVVSRRSEAASENYDQQSNTSTVKTSKTYINNLEKQLREEKEAREFLQKEIEQLKKINSEISSKLGLSIKHEWRRHHSLMVLAAWSGPFK